MKRIDNAKWKEEGLYPACDQTKRAGNGSCADVPLITLLVINLWFISLTI